jgi:hypothetical protein
MPVFYGTAGSKRMQVAADIYKIMLRRVCVFDIDIGEERESV